MQLSSTSLASAAVPICYSIALTDWSTGPSSEWPSPRAAPGGRHTPSSVHHHGSPHVAGQAVTLPRHGGSLDLVCLELAGTGYRGQLYLACLVNSQEILVTPCHLARPRWFVVTPRALDPKPQTKPQSLGCAVTSTQARYIRAPGSSEQHLQAWRILSRSSTQQCGALAAISKMTALNAGYGRVLVSMAI